MIGHFCESTLAHYHVSKCENLVSENRRMKTTLHRQKVLSLDPPKTYKYISRQWILIDQSFLKTIRAKGQKIPFYGRREQNVSVQEIAAGFRPHLSARWEVSPSESTVGSPLALEVLLPKPVCITKPGQSECEHKQNSREVSTLKMSLLAKSVILFSQSKFIRKLEK